MAGVKGKSGRRPNDVKSKVVADDSLEFLRGVMRDVTLPVSERRMAATTVAQYEHVRRNDGGKKEAEKRAGKRAAEGAFGKRSIPALKVVGEG